MKKILFVILFFLFMSNVSAKGKFEVLFKKCVDGDTAYFTYKGEEIKTRFLAIDTPEYTKEIEKYGKEASEFTCEKLEKAKIIELEYDENSDKTDKYDRHLVWVFVDGKLLQDELVKNGFAEVAYLYDDYKYTEDLLKSQDYAKMNKYNLWEDDEEQNIDYISIVLMILVVIIYFVKRKDFLKKLNIN